MGLWDSIFSKIYGFLWSLGLWDDVIFGVNCFCGLWGFRILYSLGFMASMVIKVIGFYILQGLWFLWSWDYRILYFLRFSCFVSFKDFINGVCEKNFYQLKDFNPRWPTIFLLCLIGLRN